MIKVLHVITWMDSGGAQQHVLDLLAIDPATVEVQVASGTHRGEAGSMASTFDDATTVHRLRHLRRELSIHDLAAIHELRSLIRRVRPDIVHTHSSKAGVVGRLASLGLPVTTVHNVHGWSFSPLSGVRRRAVILLERLLARSTDVLVTVSHADATAAQRSGIRPRGRIELIRSGIDLGAFCSVSRERGERSDSPALLIGTVGRLAPQKDPLAALEVFRAVRNVVPGAQFHWIGDGPLRGAVERLAAAAGFESSFQVLGQVDDVASELVSLDVFLSCSRWEGLPRGVIEAMACGVPVVATAVNGVPDVVGDGVTGRLVPAGDLDGLVTAVLDVTRAPEAARRMAVEASSRLDEFSIDETRRHTAALYQSLM